MAPNPNGDYVGPLDQVPPDPPTSIPDAEGDGGEYVAPPAPGDRPPELPVGARMAAPTTGRRVIPFGRQLKFGMRGNDVRAVQRALARGKFGGRLRGATGLFGVFTRARVKKAQAHYGLPQSGVYGLNLHAKLVEFFDAYEIFLYTGVNPNETPGHRQRRLIVAAALALYAVATHVHYTQGSWRMTIVRRKLRPPFVGTEIWEDCSSSVTGYYCVADAPDPNDLGYNGQGYTGTLITHGREVTLDQAQPGDLVFYRSPSFPQFPYAHVAVYIGGGRVISHGSEAGPRIELVDYRTGSHGRVGIRSYV